MVQYLVTVSGNLETHSMGNTEAQYSDDLGPHDSEALDSLMQYYGTVLCNCTTVLYLVVQLTKDGAPH